MAIAIHRYAGKALLDKPVADMLLDVSALPADKPSHLQLFKEGNSKVNWKYEPKRDIEFIGFNDVPMQDWDFPDGLHHDASITINDLGDVYPRLKDYADRHDQVWKLYSTPGGVRAFNLSDATRPRAMYSKNLFDMRTTSEAYRQGLNSDPLYDRFSRNQNVWNVRISGKPQRQNDYVAYPLGMVGRGMPDPRNIDLVHRYHDVPIIENRFVSGMNPVAIPRESAETLVSQHLSQVPRQFAAPVEQRLEKLGVFR